MPIISSLFLFFEWTISFSKIFEKEISVVKTIVSLHVEVEFSAIVLDSNDSVELRVYFCQQGMIGKFMKWLLEC